MELCTLLTQMTERKAFDLHLAPGVPPIFRIDGDLVPDKTPNLTPEDMDILLQSALPAEKLAQARLGQDFAVTLREGTETYRCQVFRASGHLTAAIRTGPGSIPTLEALHLPPIFEKLTHLKRGLILLAGPTGSGKTTTLCAMLEQINLTRSEHLITVEEPLNYVMQSKLCLINQRIVGDDIDSMEQGLRTAWESDPDVVFVGHLRTQEAVELALEMAETGHLVFSQITAETVSEALERLMERLAMPRHTAGAYLGRTVQAVIAQRLLRRDDQAGRVAANEILLSTPLMRQRLAEGQTDMMQVMEASAHLGMQTMAMSLRNLVEAGVISRETAGQGQQ